MSDLIPPCPKCGTALPYRGHACVWHEGDPKWTWDSSSSVPRYKHCQITRNEVLRILNEEK